MSEKKNIDRLFQEKFKDYEVFPDPIVWTNIERRILKKKKRRIVPLWLRFGSAAAILLLLLLSRFGNFNQENNLNEQPTETIITSVNEKGKTDENNRSVKEDNSITFKGSKTNEEENTITKSNLKSNQPVNSVTKANNKFIDNENIANISSQENITVSNNNEIIKPNNTEVKKEINISNELINSEKTAIAQQEISEKQFDIQQEIDKTEPIEETIKINSDKWSIGSTIAPVYFNTLSSGSPIDPSLSGNTKNSNRSISYGLKVNYKLSKKLSLQSGINTVELGYSTKNVAVLLSSSLLDDSNTNISTNVTGLSVETLPTGFQNSDALNQRSSFDLSGNLDQTLSYIEVPFEAKYNVLQKKLGVNVIGGFSTYFLYQNEVLITSFGKTSTLGEASNINSLNFSGNLGLDFDYNISKKLYINVSPMFKYQFNTFSENSGGFQPYYFGVFTGLNFRF